MEAPPPYVLDQKHQMMLGELQEASDAEFEKLYVDMQVTAHEEAVALFRSYAADGENEALRALPRRRYTPLSSIWRGSRPSRPSCDWATSLHGCGAAE